MNRSHLSIIIWCTVWSQIGPGACQGAV